MGFEVKTHKELTEKAIEVMESTLSAYLIDNVGLEGGLNASFNGKTSQRMDDTRK